MKKATFKRKTVLTLSLAFTFIFLGFKKPNDFLKLPKSIEEQFSFIPSGEVFNGTDSLLVNAFYMSSYEVSNKEYNDFLTSVEKEIEAYNIAKIDTNNWITELEIKPFSALYHNHIAYEDYPVVNISLDGAKLYCKWLTDKLNAENAQSGYTVEVRLPSRDEWLRASTANHKNAVYSWGESYLRNEKGLFLCNFKQLGSEHIFFNPKTEKYEVKMQSANGSNTTITAPVKSYYPNDFNLYNLNGNVAELVTDGLACGGSWNSTGYDVRNQSAIDYERPSSMIGFRPLLTITKKP